MRRPCPRPGQAGAALLLVLILVAALSLALAGALPLARLEVAGESTEAASVMARARVDSGLLLAAVLLARDASANQFDHPGEAWAAFFASDAERTRIMAAGEVTDRAVADLFADDGLSGTVSDETGKIPVNALAGANAPVHARVLRDLLVGPAFRMSAVEATRLVLAIRDWVDVDTDASTSDSLGEGFQKGVVGAESPYYAALGRDRLPPNAAMLSLGELLQVRGVTPGLYDGTGGGPGLRDLLTVHGSGDEGYNVNTAPEAVLAALAWQNGESTALAFARDVAAFRSQRGNAAALENPEWVRFTLSGYRNIVLSGISLTTQGRFFLADLTGMSGAARARLMAWIRRDGDGKVVVVARRAW
ncbi:MAG: type II secretion system protein GspK [Desulfovibrionaceae bacterium]|nr:type II secretion system protein GspK [Desulfovibrionaceae bacterium]